jgi:hypothetical protein
MPYKNKEEKNLKQRENRKSLLSDAKILLGDRCVHCELEGVVTTLTQFDHVDPKTKSFDPSTKAGLVSQEVFWLEVAKCQLLCRPHHEAKSEIDGSAYLRRRLGESHGHSKLRELDVKYARKLNSLGHSKVSIARELGVSEATIRDVLTGRTWSHVNSS